MPAPARYSFAEGLAGLSKVERNAFTSLEQESTKASLVGGLMEDAHAAIEDVFDAASIEAARNRKYYEWTSRDVPLSVSQRSKKS